MLNKEELRELNFIFWTDFQEFNKKKRAQNNRKMVWSQYKSGIKDIYFRLDFNTTQASFSIDLQMRDAEVRQLVYEQFLETQGLLEEHVGNEIEFQPNIISYSGIEIHRLNWSLKNVNIANPDDYSKSIQFLSNKIQGMDRFWFEFSDLFVALCR